MTRELHEAEGAGSTEDWIECQRRPTSAAAPVEGPSVSWLSDKPDDLREVKNLPCYTTSYTATCLYTSGDHIA
jgi:hypothetical protein